MTTLHRDTRGAPATPATPATDCLLRCNSSRDPNAADAAPDFTPTPAACAGPE
ncbi:MAG: hypothetical protein PSX80_16340 [bacterium]|nr:hypothetical protein [bacterium]